MKPFPQFLLGLCVLVGGATYPAAPASFAADERSIAEAAVPIQVITPTDIAQSEAFCGRALPDLVKIAPSPAINISRGQVRVPETANNLSLVDGLRIQAGDGSIQPASGPICFDNVEVLKQPVTLLYGDSTAGVMNIVTKPSGSRPAQTTLRGADSKFFTQPLYLPGEIQAIRGPFDGKGPGTSVGVNGKPGLILAETPRSLYWTLPDNTPHGSISITLREAGQGATFPVYLLGLAMSADRLSLLKGESTKMQATVFGPELMSEEAWKAGDVSDVVDLGEVAKQFPDFKIPKPGEPGRLFFRIDNVSRQIVSMSPSKNESFIVNLDRASFAGGPYTYTGTVRSKRAGGFEIKGLVVGFFAPLPGEPLPPEVLTQDPGATTPTPTSPAAPGT